MFPHIQVTSRLEAVPTTTPAASANIQATPVTAVSDKSRSAPNVVQRDVQPKTHRYSENRP